MKITIPTKAIYRVNADQITNGMFHTTKTKMLTMCMETQRPWRCKASLRKKELEESTFVTSDYTTNLQSSNSMVLAQKQKYRPMEQDTKPRNKPMHLWVPYF